jgi:hypothetical protein
VLDANRVVLSHQNQPNYQTNRVYPTKIKPINISIKLIIVELHAAAARNSSCSWLGDRLEKGWSKWQG